MTDSFAILQPNSNLRRVHNVRFSRPIRSCLRYTSGMPSLCRIYALLMHSFGAVSVYFRGPSRIIIGFYSYAESFVFCLETWMYMYTVPLSLHGIKPGVCLGQYVLLVRAREVAGALRLALEWRCINLYLLLHLMRLPIG